MKNRRLNRKKYGVGANLPITSIIYIKCLWCFCAYPNISLINVSKTRKNLRVLNLIKQEMLQLYYLLSFIAFFDGLSLLKQNSLYFPIKDKLWYPPLDLPVSCGISWRFLLSEILSRYILFRKLVLYYWVLVNK